MLSMATVSLPLNGEYTQVFLLEWSGKLKKKVWRPPWMRLMSYLNWGPDPALLKFAICRYLWEPDGFLSCHDTQRILPIEMAMGECPQKAEQRVSLSNTAHLELTRGQDPGGPSLPLAFRMVLALKCLFACLGWLVPEMYFLKTEFKAWEEAWSDPNLTFTLSVYPWRYLSLLLHCVRT